MATIDTIIKVDIALAAAGAAAPSFSIPLIIGATNAGWSDVVHAYTDPAQMLSDGFTTNSQEYKYAQKLYAQAKTPSEFFVGHRGSPVAQVDTIQVVTVTSAHVYSFDLNGVLISYTAQVSDSYADILAGLMAAVTSAFPSSPFVAPPVTMAISGSGSASTLTLTSAFSGQGVDYTSVNSLLAHVNTVSNHGISDDLAAIQAENDSWYAIALCSNADNDLVQLSSAVESLKKIYLAVSSDAAIANPASTTDILSYLKGKSLNRTGLIYSPGSANQGIEAAWMGNFLPLTPGSYNPAYMTLNDISVDTMSDSARLAIVGNPVAQVAGKNGNVYTTLLGEDVTQFGQMVGGRFLDITIGLDWLQANIQVAVFNAIFQASQLGQKIPYTDSGTAVLISAVDAVIKQGQVNGLISKQQPVSLSAPLVASVPATQRQGRLAPPISFTCTLQGAFNAATVNGTVLV